MRSNHRHEGAHKRVTVSPKVTPLYMELPQRPSTDQPDQNVRTQAPRRWTWAFRAFRLASENFEKIH